MGKTKRSTPQNRPVRISVDALRHIDEIINYIAFVNQQPLNAIKVSEAIEKTIDNIAQHPLAYKECKPLSTKTKMYRQAVCLSWLIIYRISASEILILAIIHGARHPKEMRKVRRNK